MTEDELVPALKGKGLEIGKPDSDTLLRGSLAARSIIAGNYGFPEHGLRDKDLSIHGKGNQEEPAINRTGYNHPEIFEDLSIEASEEPDRVTYEIPGVGILSLLKIDDYAGKQVLQVDVAEIDKDKQGMGFGYDMYRYAVNHLPVGYRAILSGTITHDAVRRIYETIGNDPGLLLHKIGNTERPGLYLLEPAEG